MRNSLVLACVALMVSIFAPACQPDTRTPNATARSNGEQATSEQASTQPKPQRARSVFGHFRKRPPATAAAPALTLKAIDLSDAVHPKPQEGSIQLRSAKNEWTSFVIEVGPRMVAGAKYSLRMGTFKNSAGASIAPLEFEVYQALSMPVNVNRAGYARHTGQDATSAALPRALLPMRVGDGSVVDLSDLRDSTRPTEPAAKAPAAEPALLWIDVRVPPDAVAGNYQATCDALSNGKVAGSVPLNLTVHDFALPAERHLQVIGTLSWDDLERLYPGSFETIRPRLMNRKERAYDGAVAALDALLALAHRHRTSVIVPRLQPTVKWEVNGPPTIDWTEYDSLVTPWLTGSAFADKTPVGFWPLPAPEILASFPRAAQLQYWEATATHIDQFDDKIEWLQRAPVWMDKVRPGPANEAESLELSRAAADTLTVHQRVRVAVPLETDQLHVADADANGGAPDPKRLPIEPATTERLLAAAPGLVSAPPMRLWPDAAKPPAQYLRADMPAVLPYVGAGGDERDVRVWAWLAYLRQATLIHFADALPSLSNPTDEADPNELIWFYPGEWFGQAEPVPTIQLKWLRRAQQDYEYLWLARQRGKMDTRITTLMMAQLLSKPVEIQPGQTPEPAYTLMSGTTDQGAWDEAHRLVSEMILLYGDDPTKTVDPDREWQVHLQTLPWQEPQERPLLMARTADWAAELDDPKQPLLHLRFGVDIYNASAVTPRANLLAWTNVSPAWKINTQPTSVPVLSTFNVRRVALEAKFNLAELTPSAARRPMELTFTNGDNRRQTSLQFMLPVATSDRREGPLTVDGKLTDDWDEADLAHDGRLVKMLSRPSLQRQKMELAAAPSKVYTCWAEGSFYVAFDLAGISPVGSGKAQNFVDYQFRRAWGEDLCEILIQPVGADGAAGPVLHVVCKPNGSIWVERKAAVGVADDARAWQEVEARIPYVSVPAGDKWRGEVRIPWRAILNAAAPASADPNSDHDPVEPPVMLRFNFTQHRTATGESASWAGPLDFGRDDTFMGVLYLRDPVEPGRRGIAGNGPRIRTSEER